MKKLIWSIIVIGAVILIVIFARKSVDIGINIKGATQTPAETPMPTASISPEVTPMASTPITGGTGSTKTPASTVNLTYDQALALYRSKGLLQFDARCQSNQSSLVVKTGSKIMFDNRSGDPRKFNIGGVNYNIGGYGFLILTMKGPGTVAVDCGSAQNVAKIIIEK